ncbi:ECF RNA polymerase sigma factor SigK [Lentzea sp. NPDC051838]|uniref:ECF RNA polymerase sigma factor SigK n=1 Tax=Lentzea sp. NPDC051838 TaxID=3154849 RepID=UPI003427230C
MPELVRPRAPRSVEALTEQVTPDLLGQVARSDEAAFARLYDLMAARVFGLVRRVLRDEAQSEEVFQEVMLEVWRKASRYDPSLGSPTTWIMTITHRRAVDRVRSAQTTADREVQAAQREVARPFDEVSESADTRFEQRQVRRCLSTLTPLQRESIGLAYYQGYTYPEVASLLGIALGTVKTRMRDGLIRLRDCMGVTA